MSNVIGRADHAAPSTGPFFGYTLGQVRKALVAAAGILTTLLTADLLPGSWAHWVSTAAGILTVLGTFRVGNDPVPTKQ